MEEVGHLSMEGPVLGIDLGTTNSVVAIADSGKARVLSDAAGHRLVPSVVSFHPNGDVLVGYPARERRLVDARNTIYSVKRLIGRPFASEEVKRAKERFPFELTQGPTGGGVVRARGESYALPEISAFVLRRVKEIAEEALGVTCSRAVITVPANFNELQRSATKAAGKIAGLDVLRILNEPTAAALAYGFSTGARERVAVYDLGGGTFDLTLLELAGDVFEVLATAGDTFLGGDDLDTLVADKMALSFLMQHRYDLKSDAQAFERLRAAGEWAKCQLSVEETIQLRVEELAYDSGGRALDLEFSITRDELETISRPLIARSFDVCEEALRTAGIRPTQLDNVILVGGSTRMPLVRKMVEEYFGRQALATLDPDLVVAQGAAIQGAALAGKATTGSTMARLALKKVAVPTMRPTKPPPTESIPVGPAFAPNDLGLLDIPDLLFDGDDDDALPTSIHTTPSKVPARPPTLTPTAKAATIAPVAPIITQAPAATSAKSSHASMQAAQAPARAPLLLDVTPQTLSIETVGGYCEPVIRRNAAIPVEQSRVFSTGRDLQKDVSVAICQGESRRLGENQNLGTIELFGLRPATRGEVNIEVTFVIDADGVLGVRAKDLETKREQSIRINLVGGMSEEELNALRARHVNVSINRV
ncbi:MAG: Hsp70 family protein [Sandaracinaceae bacterium]|nr:Hsp70 family protein [Sandaracinaceae bacterium]